MTRSQRHKVIIQATDSCGKGLSEKQPAPRYVNQYALSQAFTVPTGATKGPLQGSSMAGFPPTLIPLPGALESRAAEVNPTGNFSDPGQFNLSGNPIYMSLPETNAPVVPPTPQPGPDPEPGEEPTLNSINPSQARIGAADLTMNVNGSNFTETSIIYFNGGPEATEFVSASQLRTTIKPSTATTPGEYPVWVQQGSFQTVQQKTFTFLPENAEEPMTDARTLPLGPLDIASVEDHPDGIAVTLTGEADIRVGDTVLIEATGTTSVNGPYQVLEWDAVNATAVVDNDFELLNAIEGRGRLTVTG